MAGELNQESLLFWQYFFQKVPKEKAFVRVIAPICLFHCDKISHPKIKKNTLVHRREREREREMGKGSIVGFEWIWEYRNYDWNLTRRILRTGGGGG